MKTLLLIDAAVLLEATYVATVRAILCPLQQKSQKLLSPDFGRAARARLVVQGRALLLDQLY